MIHILICVIIGNALISDDQFDLLENNLMIINPGCDYFTNKKALPLASLPKDNIEELKDGYSLE